MACRALRYATVFNTQQPDRRSVILPRQVSVVVTFNGAVGYAPEPDAPNHADPRPIMDVGVLNGNMPAPMIAIDEDDELFLTLTNVGQVMRPDLFEQHTVHFHGYPNASAFYDGVPDASVAINIGGSFTYYYLAPDAGTYIWHCHITPPEHLQMGMVGQLYVRPRQNRVNGSAVQRAQCPRDASSANGELAVGSVRAPYASAVETTSCARRRCRPQTLRNQRRHARSTPTTTATARPSTTSSTRSRSMASIPNFHFVGMTFNPENFTDSKNKYFLLNGRSYPDTMLAGPTWYTGRGWHATAFRTAAAHRHQHSSGRQSAAAHLRPRDQ